MWNKYIYIYIWILLNSYIYWFKEWKDRYFLFLQHWGRKAEVIDQIKLFDSIVLIHFFKSPLYIFFVIVSLCFINQYRIPLLRFVINKQRNNNKERIFINIIEKVKSIFRVIEIHPLFARNRRKRIQPSPKLYVRAGSN